jgi:predicted amidophosphoribosyltransferase
MSIFTGLRSVVGSAADRALDLALPPVCAGCYREGAALCHECLPALDVRLASVPGVPIGLPADLPAPLLQLEWCAPFTGVARRAIHQLKYAGERRLANSLGAAMARRWAAAGAGGDVLVPVPASPNRVRERGYDQAVLLARVAGRRLHVPVVEALERTRASVTEKALLAVLRPEADAYGRTIRMEAPSWDDVAATNKHLKGIWTKVELDPLMVPTAVWA